MYPCRLSQRNLDSDLDEDLNFTGGNEVNPHPNEPGTSPGQVMMQIPSSVAVISPNYQNVRLRQRLSHNMKKSLPQRRKLVETFDVDISSIFNACRSNSASQNDAMLENVLDLFITDTRGHELPSKIAEFIFKMQIEKLSEEK